MTKAPRTASVPQLLFSSIHLRRADSRTIRVSRLSRALFGYVVEGKGTLRLGLDTYPVGPQQLFFLAPGAGFELLTQNGPFTYYVVFADLSGGGRVAVKDGHHIFDPGVLRPLAAGKVGTGRPAQVMERMERLLEARRSGDKPGFALNAQFQELIHYVLENLTQEEDEGCEDGIERSAAYIHGHYHEKIRLETLADIAGFAPTSYSREFKKRKGASPIDYLNAYRIERAKRQLMESGCSVKDAAAASGFGSEFYFSRMFKRAVGLSPAFFLKTADLRIAAVSSIRLGEILRSLGIEPVYSVNALKTKMMTPEEHEVSLARHLHAIRQSRPELIVCDYDHGRYGEQLRQIAPTVALEYSMDWRAVYRKTAEIVGRAKEAEQILEATDGYEQRAGRTLRRRFGDETVAIVRFMHKLIRVQGAAHHPLNRLIYGEIGLKPGYCVSQHHMIVEFSPDQRPFTDVDHLFIQNEFVFPDDERLFRTVQGAPEWQAMKAAKRGLIRLTPNWAAMSWFPPGRKQIIDQLLAGPGVLSEAAALKAR